MKRLARHFGGGAFPEDTDLARALPCMGSRRSLMASATSRNALAAVGLMTAILAGCSSYIKRDEFDATVAELRATDQRLQG
jgi:hypothetical protein